MRTAAARTTKAAATMTTTVATTMTTAGATTTITTTAARTTTTNESQTTVQPGQRGFTTMKVGSQQPVTAPNDRYHPLTTHTTTENTYRPTKTQSGRADDNQAEPSGSAFFFSYLLITSSGSLEPQICVE